MRRDLMILYRRRCGNDLVRGGDRGGDRETGIDIARHGVLAWERA